MAGVKVSKSGRSLCPWVKVSKSVSTLRLQPVSFFHPVLSSADQSVLCALLLKSSKWGWGGVGWVGGGGLFERTSGWLALTALRRDHVVTEVSEVRERG